MPEPSRMAGVTAIRRGSCSAISQSHWPKICEYVGRAPTVFFSPSAGLNLPGP